MRTLLQTLSIRLVRPVLAVAALTALVGTARADINSANMFRSVVNTQTGDGNSLTSDGAFLSLSLTATGADDFDTVTATYPGPASPVNLTQQGNTFTYQTALLADQATMDAQFPTGTYQFDASGAITDSTSFDYTGDNYAQSLPFLTGTDYTDLQGMNASADFTFHFSTYTSAPADSSFIFLTIYDNTLSSFAYNAGFLPTSTTEVTVGANTLQASHDYTYELIFSNRATVTSTGANFPAQIGNERRTNGTFTSGAFAVPEAGSLTLLLPVIGMLGIVLRRRSHARVI